MLTTIYVLEPVCCKKQQKKFLTSCWFAELGNSEGTEWFETDCIWVQMIPLIFQDQFYTYQNLQRSPYSTNRELVRNFFAVSYSKPALIFLIIHSNWWSRHWWRSTPIFWLPSPTSAYIMYEWPLIFLTIHSNGRATGDHGTDEDQHQGFSWGRRGRGGHQTVRVEACSMHRWSVHCCHFFIRVIHLMIPWSWTCLFSVDL